MSAGLWLSANKSSLSHAGVVTEGGGGHHCLVSIQIQVHTQACEGARGAGGLIQLQAWDQSPSRPELRPDRAQAAGATGATFTTRLLSTNQMLLSVQQVIQDEVSKKIQALKFSSTESECYHCVNTGLWLPVIRQHSLNCHCFFFFFRQNSGAAAVYDRHFSDGLVFRLWGYGVYDSSSQSLALMRAEMCI